MVSSLPKNIVVVAQLPKLPGAKPPKLPKPPSGCLQLRPVGHCTSGGEAPGGQMHQCGPDFEESRFLAFAVSRYVAPKTAPSESEDVLSWGQQLREGWPQDMLFASVN